MSKNIFKLFLILFLSCFFLLQLFSQELPKQVTPLQNGDKVLFIGNSFTDWFGPLPNTIQALIKADGSNLNVSFSLIVKGAGILKEYATWPSIGAMAEIQKGGWKYVVIQGWNDAIVSTVAEQDTMLKYFKMLDDEVVKVGATSILYEPHVSQTGYPTDFDKSASTYLKLKNSVSCFHAPVIKAWDQMRINHPGDANTLGSFVQLLYHDGGHQNNNGMALDAMTFYTIFTHRTASTLKPVIAMSRPEIYEELADIAYTTGKSILSMNNSGFTDTQAPTIPLNIVSSNISTDNFIIKWDASTDNVGVLGYEIYKDNIKIGTSVLPTYSVGNLSASTSYAIKIKAYDSEKNISDFSSIINTTTAPLTNIDTSGILMDWDFTGQGGNASVATTTVMKGISISSPSGLITTGSVFIANNFRVNGLGMTDQNKTSLADAITANQFIPFSITPQTGYEISISEVLMKVFSQNQNRNFTLMSSIKGFTNGNEISTYTSTGGTSTISITGHNTISTKVDFRIYVWGTSNNYEAFGLEDLVISGAIKSSGLAYFPTQLKANNVTETGFNLSWVASRDAISYNVYMDGSLIGNTTSLNRDISGVTINSTYSMTVAGVNNKGTQTELSAPLDVKIPDLNKPTVPTDLSVSDIKSDYFRLSWTASTDNVGVTLYEVYMNGNLYGNTVASFMPAPYLTPNTLYKVSVRAKDLFGNFSDLSPTIDVKTTVSNAVSSAENNQLYVYPNPATNYITISVPDISYKYLHIYNSLGFEVVSEEINKQNIQINIGDLSTGLYYIILSDQENKTIQSKFIID